MTKEEKIFGFMKAIAPLMVKEGMDLQKRIIAAGGNPANCTIGDMDILDAQAQNAKECAEYVRAYFGCSRYVANKVGKIIVNWKS